MTRQTYNPPSGGGTFAPLTDLGIIAGHGVPNLRHLYAPSASYAPLPSVSTVTTFQSGHGWTLQASGPAGTLTDDTADYVLGSQAVKVVTGGGGNGSSTVRSVLGKTGLTAIDLTKNVFRVAVKVDDYTHLNRVALRFGSDLSANYYTLDFLGGGTFDNIPEAGTWRILEINVGGATSVGSPPAKSAITAVGFAVTDDAAGTATAHFNLLALAPKPVQLFPNGVVTFGFDDGYLDQFTAAKPYLDKYGYPAVAYVIQDQITVGGGGNYMTYAQLHALEDYSGWEVASHAYSTTNHNAADGSGLTTPPHVGFAAVIAQALDDDFANLKGWMIENGFRGADHLAFPQGGYTDAVIAKARKYFTSARTVHFTAGGAETFPPQDRMRMRCKPIDTTSTLSTLQAQIDQTKADGSWCQFYTHRVVASPAGTQTTPTIFNGLVDYIAAQGVSVLTVGDVLRHADTQLAVKAATTTTITVGGTEPASPAIAAAGSSANAAAVDHVHPRPVIRPSDLDGYKAWSMDYTYGTPGASALSGGAINVAAMIVDSDTTLSNLIMNVAVLGAFSTAGQCFAAFFDLTGARLAVSADISGSLTSTGKKTFAMTAPTAALTAGQIIYGAIMVNGSSTSPQFTRASLTNALIVPQRFGAVAGSTGATTMVSSFTPASLGAPTAAFWMAAT